MNTTIKTTSEKQFTQIRRFVKKNKIHNTISEENGLYLTSTAKILYFSYRLIINHIRYDVRIFG